ncbi:endolytic transglycosylase MltG [Shewanella electrodiphila]|uniref:Endolytic murein transglycosylase n=1 Tax=Shewanella electrodiphila TaxID=934143 RepID=A0ABT0KMV7_9GAMM|nr:endolytic transglycosylase MltG [Shewanella electrodiphila]MCL1045186.1 endolytic transglycosylase MltG [Shewanella electrodiphila]
MKKTITIILTSLMTLTTVACVVGFWGYQQIIAYPSQLLSIEKPVELTIAQGMNVTKLGAVLESKQFITDSWKLKYLLKIKPEYAHIRTGLYQINPGDSIDSLLTKLNRGDEMTFSVTLIEGKTIKEWHESLVDLPHLTFDEEVFNRVLIKNGDESGLPEGKFFPETYQYQANDSLEAILDRSYQMMQKTLATAWGERDKDLKLTTPYELLTIASIIEKETGKPSERDWVAAVFNNRLKLGMRLQTDPTVIYGMGERYNGNITRSDLREHTAFNTYRINGLPPTPIAAPSKAAIFAAAKPADVNYLYFVSRNDGSHVFSETLAQHNRAVNEYQRNRK